MNVINVDTETKIVLQYTVNLAVKKSLCAYTFLHQLPF